MKKRFCCVLCAGLVISSMFISAAAQTQPETELLLTAAPSAETYSLAVNGETLDLGENSVYISGGKLMVPVRKVAEKLGFSVSWNNSENSGIIDEDIEQSALPPSQDDTNEGPLLSVAPDIGGGGQNGFSEFSPSDISEISQKLGYSFKIPAYLPDGYEASNASLMFESLVQITYKSPQGEMTYRTEKTNEDISGDHTEYENIQSENINGATVTLKGSKDNCSLAVWSSEGSSYSVHCLPEIAYGEMIKIIENLK